MRNLLFCVGLLFFVISCKEEKASKLKTTNNSSEFVAVTLDDVPTVDYKGLKPTLQLKDDKTYVVNFWATWCAPCIKELPYFEKVNEEYKDQNVEVILVSLDFPKQKEKRLIPFINKRKLKSEVIHFDDVNEQMWIADISEKWSGSIPATLIYNKNKRKFYEQSFTEEELRNEIKSFINK